MSVPDVVVHAFDKAIIRWLALKYEFLSLDQNGHAVYAVHPSDWEEGDYDFVLDWRSYYERDSRPRFMLEAIADQARTRGVDLGVVENYLAPPKKPLPLWAKIGMGLGGTLLIRWLLSPNETTPIVQPAALPGASKVESLFDERARHLSAEE